MFHHLMRLLKDPPRPVSSAPEHRQPARIWGTRYETHEVRALMAGVVANYAVTQDWGTGFRAQIQLQSQQTQAVNNWRLEFDYGANITSIWDAKIVSHSGNHYVVTHAGWNSSLPAGATVSFGFVASPGTSIPIPINYQLNSLALDGNLSPPPSTISDVSVTDAPIIEGNSSSSTPPLP